MAADRLFRSAVPTDAQGIAHVHFTSWQETYTGHLPEELIAEFDQAFRLRLWTRLLSGSPPWVLTCKNEERVIGFSSLRPLEEKACELQCLYVLKSDHGTGIGRTLFNMSVENAKALGFEELRLWVLVGNPAAAFYEKVGCRFIGTETISINKHPVTVSRYHWSLDQ